MALSKSDYITIAKIATTYSFMAVYRGKLHKGDEPVITKTIFSIMASKDAQMKKLSDGEILMQCPKLVQASRANHSVYELKIERKVKLWLAAVLL